MQLLGSQNDMATIRLVGLELVLSRFRFARHVNSILSMRTTSDKIAWMASSGERRVRSVDEKRYFGSAATAAGASAFSFFFPEGFPGASTTSIVRPSIMGGCSMVLMSASDWAISFRSSRAISG